jgi:hypothetical protein
MVAGTVQTIRITVNRLLVVVASKSCVAEFHVSPLAGFSVYAYPFPHRSRGWATLFRPSGTSSRIHLVHCRSSCKQRAHR